MQNNRPVYQVIWGYLRPVSQRRIRMTCRNLHNWSECWPRKIPDVTELLNVNNWSEWVSESNPRSIQHDWGGIHYRWAWIDKRVSVRVIFCKVISLEMTEAEAYLLKSIRIQYQPPQNPDHSYTQIATQRVRGDYRVGVSGRFGKKPANLPLNYSSHIYKKIGSTLAKWNGNKKIRRKLFPYCVDIFHRGQIPGGVIWDPEFKCYRCDKCFKYYDYLVPLLNNIYATPKATKSPNT